MLCSGKRPSCFHFHVLKEAELDRSLGTPVHPEEGNRGGERVGRDVHED